MHQQHIYTFFHVEAMKRLILLSHIVEPAYKAIIQHTISANKKLIHTKPFETYIDFNKLMTNKVFSYKDIEKYVKDSTAKFKVDKTNGLVKICLKECAFAKIEHTLKAYKRIRLEKLVNLVEIETPVLLNLLKLFTFKNKLNVKFDEVDGVLEIFDHDFDEQKTIQELKSVYSDVLNYFYLFI